MFSFEALIDDYLSSEHLLFLDAGLKEPAEAVLRAFAERAAARGEGDPADLKARTVEAILFEDLGRLALPMETRRGIPEVLEGFFGYLKESGRYPAAGSWQVCAEALAPKFRDSLRPEGGLKGETFRKSSTEVGRNDPCFCGSGLKYKKCCGA
jgi:hypothetical protein